MLIKDGQRADRPIMEKILTGYLEIESRINFYGPYYRREYLEGHLVLLP
jgi:hypothetical protein